LELNQDEREQLAEVFSTASGALREEIYKSEITEYKTMLKEREALMKGLLARS
jgi:hypothetical protein